MSTVSFETISSSTVAACSSNVDAMLIHFKIKTILEGCINLSEIIMHNISGNNNAEYHRVFSYFNLYENDMELEPGNSDIVDLDRGSYNFNQEN